MDSLRPTKSIDTNISKNSSFLDDKKFWPIFRRIIECGEPQETFYRVPQANVKTTVEPLRGMFLARKRLLKTQVFDKKLSFKRKKYCRLIFESYRVCQTSVESF